MLAWMSAATWSLAATAAEPSAAQRQQARKLAGEAFDLARAGDVENALSKLREADALVTAPTLKLEIGQLLEKQDRLGEAAEAYRAAIAMEVPKTAPTVHRQAREKAVDALAAVLADMPKLTVELETPSPSAKLTIDGEPAEVGTPVTLDPGDHAIAVTTSEGTVQRTVTLTRGQPHTATLPLPEDAEASATEPARDPEGTPAPKTATSGWAPLGWSLLAIGVGGLAAWGVAGGIALSRKSDLEAACGGRSCPPELQDDVDAYDEAKVASSLGFAIGVAGVVLAIPPLVFSLSDDGDDAAAFVSPSGIGVRGRF